MIGGVVNIEFDAKMNPRAGTQMHLQRLDDYAFLNK